MFKLLIFFLSFIIFCPTIYASHFPYRPSDRTKIWDMEITQADTDKDGNTYVTGIRNEKLHRGRYVAIHTRKYCSSGILKWTRAERLPAHSSFPLIARVVKDRIYIAGMLYREKNTLIYIHGTEYSTQTTARHYMLIYNFNGELIKRYISTEKLYMENEIVTDMHISNSGALFICGIQSLPQKDNKYICFIHKVDQGIIQQYIRYERSEDLYKQCVITTDGNENIYLSGGSKTTFFLAKYSSSGTFVRDTLATTYLDYFKISDIYVNIEEIYLLIEPTIIECSKRECTPTILEIYKFETKKLKQKWWEAYTTKYLNKKIDFISFSQLILIDQLIYITALGHELRYPYSTYYHNLLICYNKCGNLIDHWTERLSGCSWPISLSHYKISDNQPKLIVGISGQYNSNLISFNLPCTIEFEMLFQKGWNLISMPINIRTCGGWGNYFPNLTSIYKGTLIDGYTRLEQESDLFPGQGYWAYAPADMSYTIRGTEITHIKREVNEKLTLIGACTSITDFKLKNGTIKAIFEYDSELKSYHSMDSNCQLLPGRGYWLMSEPDDPDRPSTLYLFRSRYLDSNKVRTH